MKFTKTVSILVVFCIFMSCISTFAGATNGLKSELKVYDKSIGNVYFDSGFAECGKELKAYVEGRENQTFIYKWFLNGERIENTENSYVPTESNLECMITVEVYEPVSGTLVGRNNIFVSELPVIYIETDNREPVVIKEKELDAHIKIQGNGEYNDEDLLYEGETKIKGRGNTTWADTKKPYKLKLDKKADLFGMGKNKHWVLLSNPHDYTFSRNIFAYGLAAKMGLDYQKYISVELVLNGSHVGNYLLCEHIRIDKNRVDITDWDSFAEDAAKAIYNSNKSTLTEDDKDELEEYMVDVSKEWITTDSVTYKGVTYKVSDYIEIPDINGGYLLSLEKEGPHFSNNNIGVELSKPEVLSNAMSDYILGYYQAFEDALFSDDFCTEYNGEKVRYSDLIDMESFAKGFLVNEIFQNKDFGFRSTKMYKDVDGKLIYGPVWDFDLSSANEELTVSYYYHNQWATPKTLWVQKFYSDPYFLNELYKYYWEYRYTAIADLIKAGGEIDTNYEKIRSSAYADESIWKYKDSFDEEYNDLRQWLYNRIMWLDSAFETVESLNNSLHKQLKSIRPSPIGSVNLEYKNSIVSATKTDSRVAYAEIFNNGKFISRLDFSGASDTAVFNYSAPEDSVFSVVAYNENSQPIGENILSTVTRVSSLKINKLPDKLNYSAGDEIDLNGLSLEATFTDGSKKSVEPEAAISCLRDSIGCVFKDYLGTISDVPGKDMYISLRYKNGEVSFDVNLSAKENVEQVEALIEKIPTRSFERAECRSVIEAMAAFDDLSDEAKARVSNRQRLEDAVSYIDSLYADYDYAVVSVYLPEIYQHGIEKNNYVLIVKGNPSKIRFCYNTDNTITIGNDPRTSNVLLSIRQIGNYTLWTCKVQPRDYKIVPAKSGQNIRLNELNIDLLNCLNNNDDRISKVSFTDNVPAGSRVSFSVHALGTTRGLRIVEGTNVLTQCNSVSGNDTLSFTVESPGKHNYTLEYMVNDEWLKYNDYTVTSIKKAENIFKGDVTCDEMINSSDALSILQYATGLVEFEEKSLRAADVNNDSRINSSDALRVLVFSTGNYNY